MVVISVSQRAFIGFLTIKKENAKVPANEISFPKPPGCVLPAGDDALRHLTDHSNQKIPQRWCC